MAVEWGVYSLQTAVVALCWVCAGLINSVHLLSAGSRLVARVRLFGTLFDERCIVLAGWGVVKVLDGFHKPHRRIHQGFVQPVECCCCSVCEGVCG